jgi:hypothetical protein
MVADHLSPAFVHVVPMLQDDPTAFTPRNSQTPPAAEVARWEFIVMSGLDLASQAVSDQAPTNVCSFLRAEPDASNSSVL